MARFELKSAGDLFAKLRADCARLTRAPADFYAAFDFFVTAWHLLEWKYPGRNGTVTRSELVIRTPLLRVCENVANGAKHLVLDPLDDTFDHARERSRLVLHLEGDAQREFGTVVDVVVLAQLAVGWWDAHLKGGARFD